MKIVFVIALFLFGVAAHAAPQEEEQQRKNVNTQNLIDDLQHSFLIDMDEGKSAYDRGDYATALRE
ncbi:MAG: hypothetical protein HY273_14525 [Gammaproteobacteria bacterium]|nr:hypothetical protein [Gammaproteobacteria bacterium]